MKRVVIDIKEEVPEDELAQFVDNLGAEPWFECEIRLEEVDA